MVMRCMMLPCDSCHVLQHVHKHTDIHIQKYSQTLARAQLKFRSHIKNDWCVAHWLVEAPSAEISLLNSSESLQLIQADTAFRRQYSVSFKLAESAKRCMFQMKRLKFNCVHENTTIYIYYVAKAPDMGTSHPDHLHCQGHKLLWARSPWSCIAWVGLKNRCQQQIEPCSKESQS